MPRILESYLAARRKSFIPFPFQKTQEKHRSPHRGPGPIRPQGVDIFPGMQARAASSPAGVREAQESRDLPFVMVMWL